MNTITSETDLYQTLGLARELEQKEEDNLQLEDFMTLMVTELTHQDPFKPMDNTQLATQISQFATVSGIDKLNSSFSTLTDSMLSDQSLQAANMVGRDVLVPTNSGYLSTGGTIDGVVGLETQASNLVLSVYNPSGVLIKEINMGSQPKGEVSFSWDGMTDSGDYASAGQYQITAQAMVDDKPVSPYLLMEARVGSVSIGAPGQALALNLEGLGTVSFNDVAEIR